MQHQRAFPGSRRENHALYERAFHFLRASILGNVESRAWCDTKSVPVRRAAGESIGSAGAFLVPDELEGAILDLRDAFGALRRRALVWPMGSDSGAFPRRVSGTTASFFAENTAAGSAQITLDQVKLTPKKLGALILLSSELDQDSMYDMVDYVTNELAWAFANKEDQCAFNGDGTSTYAGMRGIGAIANDGNHGNAKVTASNDAYSSLTDADLTKLMGAVRGSALPRAAWFMSVRGFSQGLLTNVTSAYLDYNIIDGIRTPIFNGFPVIITQALPLGASVTSGNAMMAFGDMRSAAVLGQRRGLTIRRSDERYLDTDQIAILGTERFDAVMHDMGDNTNYGSMAVLVAP